MNEYEAKVRDFHVATGVAVNKPFSRDLLELREKLLTEEMKELRHEIEQGIADLADHGHLTRETKLNLLKEMADVQYVLSGMAVTFGLPLEKVFGRVHESNMSKLGEDGKPVLREDGKVLKGPRYHPPVLDDLVD